MRKISLVLADDHIIVREGLRRLLRNERGLKVVGEASNGLEAVSLVKEFKPDILVLDLMMPHLNGLQVIRELSRISPETRVVVLTMYADEPYIAEALASGALGYVLKDAGFKHLLRAIREAYAGHRYLSPPLSERMIELYGLKAKRSSFDPYDSLTPRERQILQMTAEGSTSAEIAAHLSISPRTVESHRSNLLRKLRLKNHSELVRYAVQKGILKTPPLS